MLLTAATASSLVATVVVAPPGTAAKQTGERAGTCFGVAFLGARGSGEPFDDRTRDMGKTVYAAFKEYTKRVTDRTVGGAGTVFAAQDVAVLATNRKMYFAGLDDGVRDTVNDLKRFAKRCPDQRFVLAGYSQGAMVMHRAIWKLDKVGFDMNRIDGVILIADGDRWPTNTLRQYGSAKDGKGISWVLPDLAGNKFKPKKGLPGKLKGRVHSVCLDYDIVCDASLFHLSGYLATAAGIANHLKYAPGKPAAGLVKKAAAAAAKRTNSVPVTSTPVPPILTPETPTPPTPPPTSAIQIAGTNATPVDISDDGRFVAYLDSAATPAKQDLFVWDRATGLKTNVTNSTATESVGSATLSGDGRHVAYSLAQTDPVIFTRNGPEVLWTVALDTATRTAVAIDEDINSVSRFVPTLSQDGRYLAFSSAASDLVTHDTNGHSDVFLWDRAGPTLVRLTDGDDESFAPVVSADGNTVVFSSRATNLTGAPDPNPERDVFTWHRGGPTVQITVDGDNTWTSMSNDASRLTIDGSHVRTWTSATGVVRLSTQDTGAAGGSDVSPDGQYVGYDHSSFPGDQATWYLWSAGGAPEPRGAGRLVHLSAGAQRAVWLNQYGLYTSP